MIQELDMVRVLRLLESKDAANSDPALRSPIVGEAGTVVAIRKNDWGDTIFTVEHVGADGKTEWLADFTRGEIEPYDSVR